MNDPKVSFTGKVITDIEHGTLANGSLYANFRVAVATYQLNEHGERERAETVFFRVSTYNETAKEAVGLLNGDIIHVTGYIKNKPYDDVKYNIIVVATRIYIPVGMTSANG